jgi:hypothetical protein
MGAMWMKNQRMGVFVGWVDVEHGEPLAIGDSRVMVRRPVLEKHWAHPKAHQKYARLRILF